ncbi:MAG: oligopeptide/dipeptide ABC transporter ATP-binding protein [Candidatus Limiplasma sp.]|nr:oligopeptide/dipeptide ABC transporter ATP-binding protein [Candidatus Limiplasma sp.]
METLLDVRHIRKYFPVKKGSLTGEAKYVKAVEDISFTIGKGETFGLVGESGCGKSTVGRLVLRLIEADQGQVLFEGRDILKVNKKELLALRKDIQIIFQDPYGSINPRMTAGQSIGEPILEHRLLPKEQVPGRVRELLHVVGLNESDGDKYPHEFSGGQRQRIAVARALAMNPKLIVCDEPVSALDVSIQAQILNLLSDLQAKFGIAYLFIAHGMAVVQHISHRVGVMYLGSLVEQADSSEIFENCLHPYTRALMSAVPVPDPEFVMDRIPVTGEIPSPVNPPSGCRFHTRCPYCADRCRREVPELREVSPGHFLACHLAEELPALRGR